MARPSHTHRVESTYIHMYIYTHGYTQDVRTHTYTHMHSRTHTHTHTQTYAHICTHAPTRTHPPTQAHVLTHAQARAVCVQGCHFIIQPEYKLRAPGDDVMVGDQVVLVCAAVAIPATAVSVSASASAAAVAAAAAAAAAGTGAGGAVLRAGRAPLADQPDSLEVNAGAPATPWKLALFLEYHRTADDVLKGGDVVRLFHAEQEKVRQGSLHPHPRMNACRASFRVDRMMTNAHTRAHRGDKIQVRTTLTIAGGSPLSFSLCTSRCHTHTHTHPHTHTSINTHTHTHTHTHTRSLSLSHIPSS
jgi:hypothetical protein